MSDYPKSMEKRIQEIAEEETKALKDFAGIPGDQSKINEYLLLKIIGIRYALEVTKEAIKSLESGNISPLITELMQELNIK